MNKILAEKVKSKCKDMGLSEEYINGITESIGADIKDDSTDEQAIDEVANRIAALAKLSQGEATRWAQKSKQTPPAKNEPQPAPPAGEPEWFTEFRKQNDERMREIENQNIKFFAEKAKQERSSKINESLKKHEIPSFLHEFLSVPDSIEEAKIDEYIAGISQKLTTNQLTDMKSSSRQIASHEDTKAAAEAFFKSHVKSN